MLNNAPSLIAGGTIAPSRFVTHSASADNTVTQSVAASPSPFVSQVGSKRVPGLAGSDAAIAAETGDALQVFALGDVAPIEIGAAVVRGAFLKSDANGRAITAVATDEAWALALQSGGALGAIIMAQLMYIQL